MTEKNTVKKPETLQVKCLDCYIEFYNEMVRLVDRKFKDMTAVISRKDREKHADRLTGMWETLSNTLEQSWKDFEEKGDSRGYEGVREDVNRALKDFKNRIKTRFTVR